VTSATKRCANLLKQKLVKMKNSLKIATVSYWKFGAVFQNNSHKIMKCGAYKLLKRVSLRTSSAKLLQRNQSMNENLISLNEKSLTIVIKCHFLKQIFLCKSQLRAKNRLRRKQKESKEAKDVMSLNFRL
jgi:hypothetical protein